MKFTKLSLAGLVLIEPTIYRDERGYFFESFRSDQFKEEIGNIDFIQDNESMSVKGTIRGLHYQLPPYEQSKLVRVISGKVLDVAVDIRRDSPTFGKYHSVELDDIEKIMLFIPKGFAHGYHVLSESAIFQYKVDNLYSHEYERGIIYSEPLLNINWKYNGEMIISNKDKKLPAITEAEII